MVDARLARRENVLDDAEIRAYAERQGIVADGEHGPECNCKLHGIVEEIVYEADRRKAAERDAAGGRHGEDRRDSGGARKHKKRRVSGVSVKEVRRSLSSSKLSNRGDARKRLDSRR